MIINVRIKEGIIQYKFSVTFTKIGCVHLLGVAAEIESPYCVNESQSSLYEFFIDVRSYSFFVIQNEFNK